MKKEYIENLLASCASSLELSLRVDEDMIKSPKFDLINSVKEMIELLIVAMDSNTIED